MWQLRQFETEKEQGMVSLRLNMNLTRWVCLLLLAVIVAGCSTTDRRVRWYDGAPPGTNKVALLKLQRQASGINVMVDKIDEKPLDKGKSLAENNTREIELLPGRYNLLVYLSDSSGGHSATDIPIGFTAEAGKTYEMHAAPEERSFGEALSFVTIAENDICNLWIVEKDTGKVVAGKPRARPFHVFE